MAEQTCACGCGQVPPAATRTRPHRGYQQGEPVRWCRGHGLRNPSRTRSRTWNKELRPACIVDTLEACAGGCGQKIHRAHQNICAEGHRAHTSHGLCGPCRNYARKQGALPKRKTRDRVLDAWVDLAEMGVGFREFGEQHHTSYAAWERLYLRARKAGDPRAVRIDQGEKVR